MDGEMIEGGAKPLSFPLPVFVDGGTWRDKAKCKNLGTRDFYGSVKNGEDRRPLIARAVAICSKCEVRKECFNFAKKNGEQFGVWGGIDFFISKKQKVRRVIPDSID